MTMRWWLIVHDMQGVLVQKLLAHNTLLSIHSSLTCFASDLNNCKLRAIKVAKYTIEILKKHSDC